MITDGIEASSEGGESEASSKPKPPRKPPRSTDKAVPAASVPITTQAHKQAMERERAAHERETEKADGDLRRWRAKVGVYLGVGFVVATSLTCVILVFLPSTSETLKADALKGLIGVGLAFAGFMAGKGVAKAD